MTLRLNTFTGGSDETAISTANSGGTSGDPFDAVTTTGAGAIAFDDAPVSAGYAARFTTSNSYADEATLTWDLDAGNRVGGRAEFRLSALPQQPDENDPDPHVFIPLLTINLDYYFVQLVVGVNGNLLVMTGGSLYLPFQYEIPINTWMRVEWDITTNGPVDVAVRLFGNRTTSTPVETQSGQDSTYPDLPTTSVAFGQTLYSPLPLATTYWLDNLAVNHTGFPGPYQDVNSADIPVAIGVGVAPPPDFEYHIPVSVGVGVAPVPKLIVASVTIVGPINDSHTPARLPFFDLVAVTEQTDLVAELQYDVDPGFGDPVSLFGTVPGNQTPARVLLRAIEMLEDETWYYARARLVLGDETTDWSSTIVFKVNTEDGDAMIGGTWDVVTDTVPFPHLWFAYPARGKVGDSVDAVGAGFGTTAVAAIGTTDAPSNTLTTVAPTDNAYTADRLIDAISGTVDPGHQRVAFTVPDVPSPGGSLVVKGEWS